MRGATETQATKRTKTTKSRLTGPPKAARADRTAFFFVIFVIVVATTVSVPLVALDAQRKPSTPVYGYEVVNVYPHDREAFTQGLLYRDGVLFESTGMNGRSTLRKVRLETGQVLQQTKVDSRYFAEGLTDWGTRLVQLTWNTNVGFVYDLATFKPLRTFNYTGEGWGLARDERRLIMS